MEKSIYSVDYQAFLRLLKEAREAAGLTQEQVAERIGAKTTQSVVSKCERGERRIDIVELRAFCRAIGIPFEEFVSRLEAVLHASVPSSSPIQS